jgi:hypothetical protein
MTERDGQMEREERHMDIEKEIGNSKVRNI